MLSVSTALESLYRCLDEAFPPSPGTRIYDISFALNDAFDPLLWCNHQRQWPQFYWQQRSGDEELAALGAVKTFASLTQAHDFCASESVMTCEFAALTPLILSRACCYCRGWSGVAWAAAPRYVWCCPARARSATMPARRVNFSIR